MKNQRTPATRAANTNQTRAPKETAEFERQPMPLFDSSAPSVVAAGSGWPGIPPTTQSILALQRTIGNQLVGRALEGTIIRPAEDPARLDSRNSEVDSVIDIRGAVKRQSDQLFENQTDLEKLEETAQTASLALTSPVVQLVKQTSIGDSNSSLSWQSTARSDSARGVSWGASAAFQAISEPREVSWRAMENTEEAGGEGEAFEAITGPVVKTLAEVQAVGTPNPNRLGATTPPVNFVAPDFAFNTSKTAAAGGTFEWHARPTKTANAFEGDNVCFVPPAGVHPTTLVATTAGGAVLPVFLKFSNAIANRNRAAELEHSKDIKHAYKISLKEAEGVLKKYIIGKTLGPKATEAEAEQLVLDTIQRKLSHPQLGNDKTQWAAKYETLFNLTAERDTKNWHTFGQGASTVTATKVIVKVTNGTTKINVVGSNALIKF